MAIAASNQLANEDLRRGKSDTKFCLFTFVRSSFIPIPTLLHPYQPTFILSFFPYSPFHCLLPHPLLLFSLPNSPLPTLLPSNSRSSLLPTTLRSYVPLPTLRFHPSHSPPSSLICPNSPSSCPNLPSSRKRNDRLFLTLRMYVRLECLMIISLHLG